MVIELMRQNNAGRLLPMALAVAVLLQSACSSGSALNEPSALDAQGDADVAIDPSADATNPAASPSTNTDEPVAANNGPAGNSSISIDDRRYPLDAAVADVWGNQGSHYNVNFTLTNGSFVIQPTEIEGETHNLLVPADASAVIYAEMYYPGAGFNIAEFRYYQSSVEMHSDSTAPYFTNAYVGFDTDGSGKLESGERFNVLDGSISFSGRLSDLALEFVVTLDTGQIASGYYTGLINFAVR